MDKKQKYTTTSFHSIPSVALSLSLSLNLMCYKNDKHTICTLEEAFACGFHLK